MEYFDGKNAVITGGANGVGNALGIALASHNANVMLADIDEQALQLAATKLSEMHETDISYHVVDVTSLDSVQSLADAAFDRFGEINLLFNNAGVGLGEAQRKMWDLPLADWQWGMDVNLMGVVHGIKAFVPAMLASGAEGIIVNTSSGNGGIASLPNTPIYAASKAAMTSVTEVLYQQLLREGDQLRAAILFPGPHVVNSAILASKKVRPENYGGPESENVAYEKMEDLLKSTGLKMQLTEPQEVASFALEELSKGKFWLLPPSEENDQKLKERADIILARKNPPALLET